MAKSTKRTAPMESEMADDWPERPGDRAESIIDRLAPLARRKIEQRIRLPFDGSPADVEAAIREAWAEIHGE